ncbi:hypothetical protein DFP72DRAFT_867529 [Ephemerocybe angulata]|uniref:F-box domain-containing protein n=1 Tax=Ephemerocybe angulata TaxID=980116 RepID=A0A8H6IGQ2_9AGAR|nr:hypothetical protein DFP72DRAFT_867529 [Tulosesus angulatus]
MSQPEHIENVPTEIWTKILVEVEPFDVLSVGQTCRYLHSITSSNDLWRGLVDVMCTKHDLFQPSYPVEEMTLIQLQRATVGPSLFARRLQHRGASFGTPLSEASCLEPVSNSIVSPPRPTFFSQLVPGGRFMVWIYVSCMSTAAPNTNGTPSLTMELVDFGPPGSPLSSEPAQRCVHPNIGRGTHGMSVEASVTTTSQSPETLTVGLAMVDTNGTCVASIFAITPTRPAASFDRLASATITNAFSGETVQEMLIREGNALLILGNIFIVWNFTEQTCVVIHHNVTSRIIQESLLSLDFDGQ